MQLVTGLGFSVLIIEARMLHIPNPEAPIFAPLLNTPSRNPVSLLGVCRQAKAELMKLRPKAP